MMDDARRHKFDVVDGVVESTALHGALSISSKRWTNSTSWKCNSILSQREAIDTEGPLAELSSSLCRNG